MPDVTIKYGSSTIAELSDSGTKICRTENTIVQHDIEVEYTKPAGGSNGNIFNITNNSTRLCTLSRVKGGAIIANRYYPGIDCAANESVSCNVFNEYILRNNDYEIQYSIQTVEDILTVTLNGTPISFNDGYLINITSESEIAGNTYNIVITDKVS